MHQWTNHPQAKILPHPLAGIVPWMSDDEFTDLRKSMRANGFLPGYEIVLLDGKILDGRNRYLACLWEGVEPLFREYTGDDPAGFVRAAITRRDLNPSTRAVVVAKICLEYEQLPAKKRPVTREQVRQVYGVGESSVLYATRMIQQGVPELTRMVENGEIDVKAAGEVARLPQKEQEKVVKAGPASVKAKATALRREADKPKSPPPVPVGADAPVVRRFDAQTEEILRDIRNLAAKLTRHIQTSDGKRFEQYAVRHFRGWIDYSGVKIADDGEGMRRTNPSFVALQPLYRLLAASARARAYPESELQAMLDALGVGPLDGQTPPPEPEDDPKQMVEPESL